MPSIEADTIIENGRIVAMDEAGSTAEAVACWNGRILAVGDADEARRFAGPSSTVVDLGGRTVIPGLIDSHCHPDSHAIVRTLWRDARPASVASVDALLELVKDESARLDADGMVLAWGWDDRKCGGYPTLRQLDAASPERPVYIGRTDGHIAVSNSAMLRRMGVPEDAPDPPHGAYDRYPDTGRMTGLLREEAARAIRRRIFESLTARHYAEGLGEVFALYHRHGVTSLHNSLTRPRAIEAYRMLRDAGELSMRIGVLIDGDDRAMEDACIAAGIGTGFGDEWIRIVGIEWCPDCSTSGRTAAYYEPYVGEPAPGEPTPNTGMLLHDADDLKRRAVRAHKAGLRVCIEGVGDRGVDFALDAIEAALEAHPAADHRSRVEHCCCVTPRLVERLKRLGATASSATGFMHDLGDAYVANRGYGAMKRMWPHRALIDAGVPAPGHSDAPVCGVNPWEAIWSLVNRTSDSGGSLDPGQAISVTEALRAYTTLGAWTGFEERLKGSIEVGKLADFAVLEQDPWAIDSTALRDVETAMTIVGGRTVFAA